MSVQTFTGEPQDLAKLAEDVKFWFKQQDYEVQSADNAGAYAIQAKKTSGFRTFTGTNQAFNVKIEGRPEHYTVEIGTGKWTENLAGAGLSGMFLTGGLTWVTAGLGAAWLKKLEADFVKWLAWRKSTPTAAMAPTVVSAPPPAALSIPDQIKKIAELRDMGILDAAEFEAKKKELLSRM